MTGAHPSTQTAVVLVAHGDRGAAQSNDALLTHREALAATGHFACVEAGVLKGEPTLERALDRAAASGALQLVVYPFFMADGFFVRVRLADRLQAAHLAIPHAVLPPLGVDPELPTLLLQHALSAASAARLLPASTDLLIVGHGSQLGPASADATRSAAHAVANLSVFRTVATAFLEEPPSVEDALRAASEPVLVSGFFSGDGLHAGEDVPAAIARSCKHAVYAGSIGSDPAVTNLILARLLSHTGTSPCVAT